MLQDKDNKRLDVVEEKISEAKDVGIETIQMETERKRTEIIEYSISNLCNDVIVLYIHIIGIHAGRKVVE